MQSLHPAIGSVDRSSVNVAAPKQFLLVMAVALLGALLGVVISGVSWVVTKDRM